MKIAQHATKFVGDIQVWSRYEIELTAKPDGGEFAPHLMMAPAVGIDAQIVYLASEGDPALVGTIDADGDFSWADDACDWLEAEAWIDEAIQGGILDGGRE